MIKKFGVKKVFKNQFYLFNLSLKAAPKLFYFQIFICLELSLFVFLEYTVWMGYNLGAVEENSSFGRIMPLTLMICLLFVFHHLLDSIYFFWVNERIKPVLVHALQNQIYEKALSADLSSYENMNQYQNSILSSSRVKQCTEQFLENSFTFMRNLDICIIWSVYLLFVDRVGFLVALACLLVKLIVGHTYHGVLGRQQLEMEPARRKRSYLYDAFYQRDLAKELRLYLEMEDMIEQEFSMCSDKLKRIAGKYSLRLWIYGLIKDYLPHYLLLYAVYLPYLLWQVIEKKALSMTAMVILLAVVRRMSMRGGGLIELLPTISSNSRVIEEIRVFLSDKTNMKDGERIIGDELETLTLSHVNFSYGKDEKEILSDINMEIRRGQKIALVGDNGAGKSTLVKLLMRLYDPVSGTICRNSVDVRNLRIRDYRKEIGAVFQDYKMYAATLRENVVMGACSMNRQETYDVEKALHRSGFFLTDSRMKYQIETPLTREFEKDGVSLSMGESQKVAIARVFYGNYDLIILDEPFGALDPSVEYQLNEELRRIACDKTVIFITHRLSAVKDADRIYMMEKGQIAEQGTHTQLMALGGTYSQMWKLQAEGYR